MSAGGLPWDLYRGTALPYLSEKTILVCSIILLSPKTFSVSRTNVRTFQAIQALRQKISILKLTSPNIYHATWFAMIFYTIVTCGSALSMYSLVIDRWAKAVDIEKKWRFKVFKWVMGFELIRWMGFWDVVWLFRETWSL
ncbi:hypothetical protein BJ508DRAFT_307801 [Ascobolus immersus RN42]|uniref:Uncharacterized protein n=1 Tax=Ascobolus immersus RN42 TaxID=1160509 RepID=A0A3N4I1V6_ASCIM|nr:hypothetical protein BJ508DRAFT_307801 [Ascobolus immersus RN42]